MKPILFLILFIVSNSINAQKLTKKLTDSIFNIICENYILNNQSEHAKAIKISNQLLEFIEPYQNNDLKSQIYSSLSYSYAEIKDKEKAFEFIFKAIALDTLDNNTSLGTYNDLGSTYEDFGMIDKAKESYLKATKIASKYDDKGKLITPLFNLGRILSTFENKHIEAEPYLLKSLSYLKKSNLKDNECIYVDIYVTLGVVNHKLKRYDMSKAYFEKGFKLATENKYFSSLLKYYEIIAKLNREDGQFKEAISAMEKSYSIRDTIEKRKELALVKKIEAEYKVKESEEKLHLIKQESAVKDLLFRRSKLYNVILVILSMFLLIAVYFAVCNNKKLQIAKNKAVRLTKIKSAFYSEISHELRTPLFAVIELSNLLLKENKNKTHLEYLESLNFSASHLIALVNNVLELNKVESGELKINLLNTNLENLFSNIINSLEYALLQSNNTISLSYDKTIPEQLIGDSLKLSQIMINLVSNAIKFTRHGHIDVIVKKLAVEDNMVKLYFEVSDNGAGISEENQKKIFEAYYQDTYQTDQTVKGTGLGLAIVHRLLSVLGTEINIESEVNKGAKFFFELPFAELTEVKSVTNDIEILKEKIKGLHLLIVDDNLINQLVTKKILESLEVTFDVVNSGKKAIEIVKTKKIDCILMDLHMPVMDGYTASIHIREFNTVIPIIAFTAANSENIDSLIKSSGMNACVFKPFFTSDLVETICKVLNTEKVKS